MQSSMHEAKTQLSKLVERARGGEEVVLTHGRKRVPVAKLVAIDASTSASAVTNFPVFKDGKRPIGLYKGKFDVGPEFFEPLPEDELALWEGRVDRSDLES